MRTLLCFAFAFALAACGDDSDKTEDLSMKVLDASVDAAQQVFAWNGTVQAESLLDGGVVPDAGLMGLDGTVCLLETQACDLESGGGFAFALPVPIVGGQSAFGASALSDGYLGQTIFAGVQNKIDTNTGFLITGGPQTSGAILMSDAQATAFLGAGGLTYPTTTTGYVGVVLVNPNDAQLRISGATATISTSGAKTVYADADGNLDATLTTTTTSGRIVFGNVTPGAVTVTATAPGMTCQALYNWFFPNTNGNSVGAEVAAGTITTDLIFECF